MPQHTPASNLPWNVGRLIQINLQLTYTQAAVKETQVGGKAKNKTLLIQNTYSDYLT